MHQLADADLIWQQCLFAFEEPSIDATFATMTRTWLDDESWVDHAPLWLHGADRIFGELIAVLPWKQREVTMYDRRLPEPRLTAWCNTSSPTLERCAVLGDARAALTQHYAQAVRLDRFQPLPRRARLGGMALRPRAVSGSRIRPSPSSAPANLARSTYVRRGGGPSRSWQLGHGDLFVMGGSCQHDWQHCVPKVALAGPRLSIMFRHNLADAEVRD